MIKRDRLIQTFFDFVQIDSPSGYEEVFAKYIAKRLKKLDGNVEFDSFGNVIAKFQGIGEPMMLNAHLDTVEPGRGIKPRIEGDRIVSNGKTILGGDSKAGLAAIIEAITSLKESKAKHVPLEIVFTLGEETGLLGAVNLDYTKITAKHGVTFDGKDGVNNITTSAPGYTRVDVFITGLGYHASEPHMGLSAILVASSIISKMKIGKIDEETTANIGLIEGGSARNAVPENVYFKAEIRSLNHKKLIKHTAHFQNVVNEVLKKFPRAKIYLDMQSEFDPYVFNESHVMIRHAKKILKDLKLKPILEPSLGGTDVNIFHKFGIEAICVGNGSYDAHTTREYVLIPELLHTAKFCEKLVLL